MNIITRHCRLAITFSLALLLCSSATFAQRDYSNVEIQAHHVAGTYYYLEGAGGNIGLSVGEDGVVMIDDQFAPLTDKIVAAIGALSDGEIRFLINTHVHGDHTGGNENLGKMGVLILARDEVRVRLEEQSPEPCCSRSSGASDRCPRRRLLRCRSNRLQRPSTSIPARGPRSRRASVTAASSTSPASWE